MTRAVFLLVPMVLLFGAPGELFASRADLGGLRRLVIELSREQGRDPALIDAIVWAESGYNPRAVSRKGAMGLMQLMPATARRLRVTDPFDPEQNLRGGIREFSRLLDRYAGEIPLALAAYNAGEGAVTRYRGIPPYRETRGYVQRILTKYNGRPYHLGRLGRAQKAQVRMARDPLSGERVITNQSLARTGRPRGTAVTTRSGKRALQGGFGN